MISSFDDFLSSSALGCNITIVNSNSSSSSKKSRSPNAAAKAPITFGNRRRRLHFLNKRQENNKNEDDDVNMNLDHPSKGSLVLIDEIPNLHTVENHQRFRYVHVQVLWK